MITIVKDWAIVTVKDELSPFEVLWAIVVDSNRFKSDDYVCSSRILYIENNLVRTHTGSKYELVGNGNEYVCTYVQLISLMNGLSPEELNLESI